MNSDNTFYGVVGLLSAAGWAANLVWETPISELAGWFAAVAGAMLLAAQFYQQLK